MASKDSTVSNRDDSQAEQSLRSPPAQESEELVLALRQVLTAHSAEHQLVLLQDFPDPDALSSAWAYQLIATTCNITCDILYAGTLSHQENIALVKLTGLPARRWVTQTGEQPDFSQYQGYVLVDSQGATSQLATLAQAAKLPLVVVIDHHARQDNLDAEFVDIRPQIRATATILTQ